jgi:HSP20 family protein
MFGFLTNPGIGLFDQLQQLQREMDDAFGVWAGPANIRAVAQGAWPAINVGTTAKQVDVYLFAAGLDPDKLDISIQNNTLSISGERKIEVPEAENYYLQERFNGEFRRVLTLPTDVDPNKVDANYKNGVLHITVQRSEASQPKQIKVK